MDSVEHKDLAAGRWAEMSFAQQMGNIGSEVSRAIKNQHKPARFEPSFNRALELFDLSISATRDSAKLQELCRAREEFCDYFNGNAFGTNAITMQKYYDQFALLTKNPVVRNNMNNPRPS